MTRSPGGRVGRLLVTRVQVHLRTVVAAAYFYSSTYAIRQMRKITVSWYHYTM